MTVTSNRESRVIVSASGFSNPIDLDQYVEDASHLKVYADATLLDYGVEWTVAGLLDDTGVEVTITATGLANYSPTNWVVYHEPPVEQGANLSLGGRFGLAYEQALDATTRRNQSLEDRVNRGLRLPVDTPLDASVAELPSAEPNSVFGWNADGDAIENKGTLPDITGIADLGDEIVTLAGISANITTVAGISANVTTVAGVSAAVSTLAPIAANITTVAGINANVTTVAGVSAAVSTLAPIAADITTVAGIHANVTTVAGVSAAVSTLAPIAANITTVAGISANVTTVAGVSAAVSTLAPIAANITTVAGVSAAVTTVAGISADVTTVAGISANVTTVANNMADINAVAADIPSLAAKLNKTGSNLTTPAEKATFQTAIGLPSPRLNLIVNPRMQISQENGNTAGATNGYYAADQHFLGIISSAAVVSFQRVQSVTPRGSKDRLRLSVTTADVSLAAGEYAAFRTKLEGNRVAHLKFGAAGAVQLVDRFGFKGPAGTYSVAYQNSAGNRSYTTTFTISVANTDTEITVVVPGDTSGTWLTDTGVGIERFVSVACGSTFQTTAGAWAAGDFRGTSAVTNGLASNTNVFELFDVGLYADPDGLGIAPAWVPNDEAFDEWECLRYAEALNGGASHFSYPGLAYSANAVVGLVPFRRKKRTGSSTVSLPPLSSNFCYTTGGASGNTTGALSVSGVTQHGFDIDQAGGSGFTTGQAALLKFLAGTIFINNRM